MCFYLLCHRDDVPVVTIALLGAPSATSVSVVGKLTPVTKVPVDPALWCLLLIGMPDDRNENGGRK